MVLDEGKSGKKSGFGKRQRRDRNNEKSDFGHNFRPSTAAWLRSLERPTVRERRGRGRS
jgi:hypothetical protein